MKMTQCSSQPEIKTENIRLFTFTHSHAHVHTPMAVRQVTARFDWIWGVSVSSPQFLFSWLQDERIWVWHESPPFSFNASMFASYSQYSALLELFFVQRCEATPYSCRSHSFSFTLKPLKSASPASLCNNNTACRTKGFWVGWKHDALGAALTLGSLFPHKTLSPFPSAPCRP